jgi:hypothetical protein
MKWRLKLTETIILTADKDQFGTLIEYLRQEHGKSNVKIESAEITEIA